ncbi:MAG: hypothetical protein GY906_01725 [bacterium]|nr:hypothetical protein [bacterium]
MKKKARGGQLSRRSFLHVGGAVAAGAVLPDLVPEAGAEQPAKPTIQRFRTLGRTGFEVSDISVGCGGTREANVFRYAYDHGVNYFDNGESYGNGDRERTLGEAMQHMDREKVFVTTKLVVKDSDTETTILDRFGKCQERLKTEYVDALFLHSVTDVKLLGHEGYHAAVKRLRNDGRLRFTGLSSHGPRDGDGDSMETVLCTAAEDGRFDAMLFVYNFMNSEAGEKVLAACKKNNVGTTAMKTGPGASDIPEFDEVNPSESFQRQIDRALERGSTREKAIADIKKRLADRREEREKTIPFREKYGLTSNEELKNAAVQWVLNNPDMHTVCVGLKDFDAVDRFVPLSGTSLDRAAATFLSDYETAYSRSYCRHGCTACADACPERMPVSTIMRYCYYFTMQGREKHAMQKYSALAGQDASRCESCSAPCTGACPYNVNIQANLINAGELLRLA